MTHQNNPRRKQEKNREQNSPVSPARPRLLLFLLLFAAVVFLATLPWQWKQWQKTKQMQQESALQEARLRDLQLQQEEARSAESRLRAAPQTDPNARIEAARTLLARGDSNGAGKLLYEAEKLVLADPNRQKDAAIFATLAGLFQDAGWVDRALPNAQRAVELAPDSLEALLRLAITEAQLGWEKECHVHVAAALKIAPTAAEPHLALALLHDQVGALVEAEKELLAGDAMRPNDMHIALLLFRNRMGQHEYDKALKTLEKFLSDHPSDPNLLSARAEALIERATNRPGGGNKAELQTALEAALQYQKFAQQNTDASFLIGKALRGLGDEAGAQKQWEAAYAAQPNQPGLAFNLGRLLFRRGDSERGRKLLALGEAARAEATEYNRLVTSAGTNRYNADRHRELAQWCQEHGRLSRAIAEWEQVLQLRPEDARAKQERDTCWAKRMAAPSH